VKVQFIASDRWKAGISFHRCTVLHKLSFSYGFLFAIGNLMNARKIFRKSVEVKIFPVGVLGNESWLTEQVQI